MQYIDFKVQHQTITRTDNYTVVGNSQNYLRARFQFCQEWVGLTQTAVFSTNGGKHYSVLIENGECMVPWEVLCGPEFWVGVFAGERITTSTARVLVRPGVKLNATPGVQPTPSAYEQLVDRVENASQKMPCIGDNENWWVWDAAAGEYEDTGKSAKGADGVGILDITWAGQTMENTGKVLSETYRITFTDLRTFDFTVNHGVDGNSGYSPRIGPNGNWWLHMEDTGVKASGEDGVGIASISLPSAYLEKDPYTGEFVHISDTYTITLTDDSTFDFKVNHGKKGENGVGITGIKKTGGDGSPGTTDTYTIYRNDGGTFSFDVYNGKDGAVDTEYCVEFGTLEYNSDTTEELTFNFSQSYSNAPVFIPHANNAALTLTVEALQTETVYYGGKITVRNTSGESIAATIAVSAYCSLPIDNGE